MYYPFSLRLPNKITGIFYILLTGYQQVDTLEEQSSNRLGRGIVNKKRGKGLHNWGEGRQNFFEVLLENIWNNQMVFVSLYYD
jgi:hypothetical protein